MERTATGNLRRGITDGAGWLLRLLAALCGAVMLFSVLPMTHGIIKRHTTDTAQPVKRPAPVVMTRKTPEKRSTPLLRKQNIRSTGRRSTGRPAGFSMRFTPDLGVGSADGVALGDGGMATGVFDEEDVDKPPRRISGSQPVYPRRAKDAGLEGVVSLVLLIDRTGRVRSVTVSESPGPLFDGPVLETVRQWRFSPAEKGGVTVEVRMRQNIVFKLDS